MSLYIKNIISKKLSVPIKYVGTNIAQILEQILSDNFEGKCCIEGYVKRGSVKIITFSSGNIAGNCVIFTVVFEYLVCNPPQGMRISCAVNNITNAGILAHIDEDAADWHKLIRAPHFIHETKLIKPLLKEFQQKRNHMAIVVDEFGGTSGIVTLEDIVEEIIGEIKDEFDEEDLLAKKIDDNNYLFEGKTLINDVCRILAIPVEIFEKVRGESDSLAGLVLEIAGKFPAQNETVYFENFGFTVVQLDKRRIQKIKLTINSKEIIED
jgi:DNA-directed RNA polymerase subunit E'/Rpb7